MKHIKDFEEFFEDVDGSGMVDGGTPVNIGGNIAGMGNVITPQPSMFAGSTLDPIYSAGGGTVGSGDVSLPYAAGGGKYPSMPIAFKKPSRKNKLRYTRKKDPQEELLKNLKKFSSMDKQTPSSSSKFSNMNFSKIPKFGEFNINKINKVED